MQFQKPILKKINTCALFPSIWAFFWYIFCVLYFHTFLTLALMGVFVDLTETVALNPGKEFPVLVRWEAEWSPQLFQSGIAQLVQWLDCGVVLTVGVGFLVVGYLLLLQKVQIGSEYYPATYPLSTWVLFTGGKVGTAWGSQFASK